MADDGFTTDKALRLMATRTLTDEYKHWYHAGWRYSQSPSASLDYGDRSGKPAAWFDGYFDLAAGRPKWSTPVERAKYGPGWMGWE
jgi:hypothetical protein